MDTQRRKYDAQRQLTTYAPVGREGWYGDVYGTARSNVRFRPSYFSQQQLTTYAPQHTDGGSYGGGCADSDADYMGGIFGDASAYGNAPGAPVAPAAPTGPGIGGDPLAAGIQAAGTLITSWVNNKAANKQAAYQAQIAQAQAQQAAYMAQMQGRSGGGGGGGGGSTWLWVAGGAAALALVGGAVIVARKRKGGK
jgi:hypothetical protein